MLEKLRSKINEREKLQKEILRKIKYASVDKKINTVIELAEELQNNYIRLSELKNLYNSKF